MDPNGMAACVSVNTYYKTGDSILASLQAEIKIMAATYFHGNSEMQGNGDALQTLILMNPAYVGYSDNQHHLPPPPTTNFIFLNNSSSSASAAATQIHHFSGIPLQASPQHQDVSNLHGGSSPRFHYNPQINGGAAREVTRAKQGLSLSLSSQQPAGPAPETVAALPGAAEVRVLGGVPDNVVLSCKYLKVAQQLLDEVVNIGKEAKNGRELSKEDNGNLKNNAEAAAAAAGDGGAKGGAELTTAEKQEIQMKKVKLVGMLDEVEQRYKQYEQQMQMVISWFEEAGGVGSAKTYTALALQTISKQFRCLKDAIMAQIGAATRKLGEEENFGRKLMEGSRLKYIDNQIRQQQLGMIQNSAWRPQRGLPERSVSVLRAWLFQHFLHPYPKDTDKIMLAKQAGLTRSQVSNWFINARVRLWKPMVEEMYAEEIKGQQRSGSSTDKSSDEVKEANTKSQEISNVGLFNLIGSSESEMETQQGRRSPKKPRNTTIMQREPSDVSMRFGYDERLQSREGGFTISGAPPPPANNFFGTYPIMGVEQFQPPYSSNGVSLTLGLQHSNQNRSSSVENDFGSLNVHHATSSPVYDNIDVHNSKRFADFVT